MKQETALRQLKELERLGGVHPHTNFRVAPNCPIHGVGKGGSYRKQDRGDQNPLCICNDAKVGVGVKKMRLAAEGWREEWQTLIAILMSARTRDEVTVIVAENLFAEFSTLQQIGKANPRDIERIIGPVNFFQNKTKYVIAIAEVLIREHKGKPPHDIAKLILLPGVGRKTANVFLAEYGADAIGVDTHVSYISQKLGWTKSKTPDKIEQDLLALFPRTHWRKLNSTLVRFGKTYQSRTEKDALLEKM